MKLCSMLALSGLGVAVLGASAQAVTLVSDTFTTADPFINFTPTPPFGSGSLANRAPDTVNAIGQTYKVGGNYPYWSQAGGSGATPSVNGGVAALNTSVAPMLNLQGYTLPGQLTVSADLKVGTTADGADAFRGALLGFWSAPGGDADSNFTGLAVEPGTGTVKLVVNGSGTPAGEQPFVGTFSNDEFYNLSCTIDTTTGAILAANFAGQPLVFATTALKGSAINYVGFGVASAAGGTNGYVDNFLVTDAVPEPASVGLLAVGAVGVLARRRR